MFTTQWLARFCTTVVVFVCQAGARADCQVVQPPAATVAQGRPTVCGGQPFCFESLSFAAKVSDFQPILQNTNNKTLTLRMTFRNKLNRPLILGYVSGSGVATDDRGNRYLLNGERAVQGIGLVQGGSADSKFILQPGEFSDARFEFVWNTSGQEIFGLSFQVELAIREIDPIPGNQMRLGREHALHFSGLANRAGTALPGPPRPTPAPAQSPASTGAPAVQVPSAAPVDPCAGRPRCYNAGPFVAELTGLTPSFANNSYLHLMQAKVRFRNLVNQPITLGYVVESAVMTDNYGGRYTIHNTNFGDGAKGIGLVQRNDADPQFVLQPGATGDATFTLSRNRSNDKSDPIGSTFSFDMTIAQLEVLASQQIRTTREYSVGMTGLSTAAAGGTAPPASGVAPSPVGADPAQTDACGKKPRCYSAGPFVAEVSSVTSSFANNNYLHLIQAKIQFRNLTGEPIVLAYVADSAVIVDNYGGRYTIRNTNFGDGAKGIGTVRGNQADPQFVLRPGASGDATFTLSRNRNNDKSDPIGSTFVLDLTAAHLEVLASQQIRTVRDYSIEFTGITVGKLGSFLNQIIKGPPKHD
jgi:hypothetical protein